MLQAALLLPEQHYGIWAQTGIEEKADGDGLHVPEHGFTPCALLLI